MKIFGAEILHCEPRISAFSLSASHARCQIEPGSSSMYELQKDVKNALDPDHHTEKSLLDRIDNTSTTYITPHDHDTKLLPQPWQSKKKPDNDQTDMDEPNRSEKNRKKPDTIIPCPRCNSMDTKFCYFNNYNVNQPRHFCKKCQRYWTAGGTMRNVPIGAGRRKNKHHFPNHGDHICYNSYSATPVAGEEPSTSGLQDGDPMEKEIENDALKSQQGYHPFWVYPIWDGAVFASFPPNSSNNLSVKQQPSSVSPPSSSSSSSAHSAGLGKHVREVGKEEEEEPERLLWAPKTLRFGESGGEALKNSIWAATFVEVGSQKCESVVVQSGNFKAFSHDSDAGAANERV